MVTRFLILTGLILTTSLVVGQSKPHASLSQQKVCAEEAQKAFSKSFKAQQGGISYEFTNHYDSQMNVCYILVHGSGAVDTHTPYVTYSLFDAVEGRTYGEYTWINNQKKKYWEVEPMECFVTPRGSDKVTCKSADEFDRLVDKYFGIGK